MCGICGEMTFDGEPVQRAVMEAMRDTLAHRGPDDSGLHVDPGGTVGLGFRRLRIVDLSPAANQPIANEDGTIWLVMNGEIYNFRELRRRLESRGHRFRSKSDAETIVHLYEEDGGSFVDEIEGMFALALWDGRRRRMVLARDRAGKKPLFLLRDSRRLVFASEIKALFRHPDVPIDADPTVFPHYFLHGYAPNPRTFYRGIEQIEPAVVLTITPDGTTTRREYWRLEYPRKDQPSREDPPTAAEAALRVRALLTEAVERRLIADVPLGAFLSGGIDSTIVVGLMTELGAAPVKTFSIGFEGDPKFDETHYARIAARRFGAEHTEFRVAPRAVELMDTLVWHYDGPCGDSSAVPTYVVSKLTAERVTVVLTGDGGDELFAGYLRFAAGVAAEHVPRRVGRVVGALLATMGTARTERHWLARARRHATSVALPLHERVTRWNSLFFDDIDCLLHPDLAAAAGPVDRLGHISGERPRMEGLTPLSQLLHANFRSYLVDDLLVKTDRCSMANGLEARSPFLDRALVEYAASLPDGLKLRGWQTKRVLRKACADLLPPEIAARGKMGFGVPLDGWFRSTLKAYLEDNLLAGDARYPQYLSRPEVERVVGAHISRRANLGQQLWALLSFERWLRLLPEWATGRAALAVVG
ncbi:MAG: asparagine synthase (glutamine-hydrolyzing) [Acidobacteriota bacterium]